MILVFLFSLIGVPMADEFDNKEPVVVVEPSEVQKLIEYCKEDRSFFVKNVIGDHIYPHQERVLRDLGPRTAVHGCHGSGKDRLAAWLVWWFRLCFAPANVYVLGPSQDQVEDVIWQEIVGVYQRALARGLPFGGEFTHLFHEAGQTFMRGIVAKKPENIHGRHAANQLVLFDEASGIDRPVHVAAMSLLTAQNNWALAIGNPTFDPGGWFPEVCRSGGWITHRFDGYEVANYQIPGGISWAWVKEFESLWGKDSQLAVAKIRGEFPTEASDALFALAWIERAMAKSVETWVRDPALPMSLGVDVARFGSDETVLSVAQGNRIIRQLIRHGQDTMKTVADTLDLMDEYGIDPLNVRIDDTGVGGGVTDRLRELKKMVRPVNFGAKARDQSKYFNARTEMYVHCRDLARDGLLILPKDPLLLGDFCSVEFEYGSERIYKLRPKAEMKKEIGRSPDRADSAVLALVNPDCLGAYAGSTARDWTEWAKIMARKGDPNGPIGKGQPVVNVSPEAAKVLAQQQKPTGILESLRGFIPKR